MSEISKTIIAVLQRITVEFTCFFFSASLESSTEALTSNVFWAAFKAAGLYTVLVKPVEVDNTYRRKPFYFASKQAFEIIDSKYTGFSPDRHLLLWFWGYQEEKDLKQKDWKASAIQRLIYNGFKSESLSECHTYRSGQYKALAQF